MKKIIICLLLVLSWSLASAQKLVDKKATRETKALFNNLKKLSQQNILFGHHESDAYGVGWTGIADRSDVKDVCGDYPAVHGWDVGKEGEVNNIDGVDFNRTHQWIRQVYERGGINTISWHMDNPSSGGNAWDTTRAVTHILPGGKDHAKYVKRLDLVADFLDKCTSGETKIPIIFRPFHEHNGNWFWWGKGHCTEKEYVQLWRFTVDYLKNKRKLHHLLYAFSPDRSRMDLNNAKTSYLYAYPGDDYVDILGYDNYMDVGVAWNTRPKEQQLSELVTGLRALSQLAKAKNKIAALTETGLEGITNAAWFTEVILDPLKANPDIHLAYIMVWRNGNEKHHYAPYPGHPSVEDFMKFSKDPYTLFEGDLQHIYQSNQPVTK